MDEKETVTGAEKIWEWDFEQPEFKKIWEGYNDSENARNKEKTNLEGSLLDAGNLLIRVSRKLR
jgi:hypothetical protein